MTTMAAASLSHCPPLRDSLSLSPTALLPSAAVDFSAQLPPFQAIPFHTFRFDCHDFQLLPLSCLLSVWPQKGLNCADSCVKMR